jgi:hypothetical protein
VALTGTGTQTELSRSPATLAFGDRDVDDGATAAQSSTVINSGTESVTLTGVSVGGSDPGQFERLTGGPGDCVGTLVLATGESCEVRVRFDPSSTGAKTASVTVTSSAADVSVALTGTGTQAELSGAPATPPAAGTQVDAGRPPGAGTQVDPSRPSAVVSAWSLQRRDRAAKVVRRRTGVHVRTGYAVVCPAGGPACVARLTLKVVRRTRSGRRVNIFLTPKSRPFTVAAGTQRRVTLRLSRSGARRLSRAGRLTAVLRGSVRRGDAPAVARSARLRLTAPRAR